MTVLETVILGNEKHLRRTFTTNDGEVDLYTISTDRDIKIYQESDLAHLLIQRCEGRNSFGHPSSGFIEQILRKLGRPAQRMQRARPELH